MTHYNALTGKTTKELTALYNDLADKNVKVGSYPKAKLIDMILVLAAPIKPTEPPKKEKAKKVKEVSTDTFTMTEAAASIGITAKVARARYRNVENDGKRTFYIFPRSDWDKVIGIISPKRGG